MRLFILALLILFSINSANAQWYEAQGKSVIMQGDNERAKTLAMENALKKALLVAGASVSSVQKTVNGLLTQNEINIPLHSYLHKRYEWALPKVEAAYANLFSKF